MTPELLILSCEAASKGDLNEVLNNLWMKKHCLENLIVNGCLVPARPTRQRKLWTSSSVYRFFRLTFVLYQSTSSKMLPGKLPWIGEWEKEDVNVFMNNYDGLNHTYEQFSFQSPLERREKVFQARNYSSFTWWCLKVSPSRCRFSLNNLFINLFSNWRKIVSRSHCLLSRKTFSRANLSITQLFPSTRNVSVYFGLSWVTFRRRKAVSHVLRRVMKLRRWRAKTDEIRPESLHNLSREVSWWDVYQWCQFTSDRSISRKVCGRRALLCRLRTDTLADFESFNVIAAARNWIQQEVGQSWHKIQACEVEFLNLLL